MRSSVLHAVPTASNVTKLVLQQIPHFTVRTLFLRIRQIFTVSKSVSNNKPVVGLGKVFVMCWVPVFCTANRSLKIFISFI
jgi:hypothetical protein